MGRVIGKNKKMLAAYVTFALMGMSLSGQTMAAAGTTDEVYALPDVVVVFIYLLSDSIFHCRL